MAELQFFTGTMDSGKSTLALQTNHNHAVRGRVGRMFTSHDRAGTATVSSRLGLEHEAVEVDDLLDFWAYVVDALTHGARLDYLICDEAQFFTPDQVDQLARVVDELQIDVFCFGILTDFRSRLFPGSARLVELADRMHVLQVEALCWCGQRATHNARTENGEMVTEGEVTFLDVRWQLGRDDGREQHEAGHVPRAAYVDLETDLADPPHTGVGGRHPLPDPERFGEAMRAAGVHAYRPVVVYDAVGGTSAARAWWLLRHHGHDDVRVLDGGWPAWVAARGPVETGPGRPPRGDFAPGPGRLPVLDATGAAAVAAD